MEEDNVNLSNVARRIALVVLCVVSLVATRPLAAEKLISHWELKENQLDIKEGGRVNTIAVNPSNSQEIIVASETGGLFKSTDGGLRWRHLDKLPVILTQSVAYHPRRTHIVYATAKADFKKKNGGGVWRSLDGGETWDQATLTVPGFDGRLSAYEISVWSEFGVVAVGTSQGVFISRNRGDSWEYSDVFGDGNRTVSSVLVHGNPEVIYAGGPSGVRMGRYVFPAYVWAPAGNLETTAISDLHAFERSPISWNQAYVITAAVEPYRTTNNGQSWIPMRKPLGGTDCGGAAFIRGVTRHSTRDFLDLYFGNRCGLYRMAAPRIDESANHDAPWVRMIVDRGNPRDFAAHQQDPMLLGTTAGLHNTADRGATWTIQPGGPERYNALQVTEVKGQYAGSTLGLYVGTQDNKLWSATIWGVIHRSHDGSAFYIEGPRNVNLTNANEKAQLTFVAGQHTKLAQQNLNPVTAWNGAPGEAGKPAFLREKSWVQQVQNGLAVTTDSGGTWQQFAVYPEEPRDIPKLGAAGDDARDLPTLVYQPYKRPRMNRVPASNRLMRIHRDPGEVGNATVFYAAMNGFGGLGINPTMFAWYQVFGVDSENPLHIIAPDVQQEAMMESRDGGENWTVIHGLTELVTKDGELLFRTDLSERGLGKVFPIVTAVSFNPRDSDLVLIGTSEGGIYFSSDNGLHWRKIQGSEPATYITSFFWQNANNVFVSTYGRGLWKLTNVPVAVAEAFEDFCLSCEVVATDSGPEPRFDGSLLVYDGRLLGMRTEKSQLREVLVTPGSSVIFTGDQNDPQQDIVITENDGRDTSSFEALPKGPDGWIATGVVFTSDDTVTGAAFAKSEMSRYAPVAPEAVKGSTDSPSKGQPCIRLTSSGNNGVATAAPREMLALAATNLAAGASYEVLIDGVATKGTVIADAKGSFETRLSAPAEHGYHLVEVRMLGDEEVVDDSVFIVRQED